MINTIWQGFSGFHVAFVIKRLLCIEFRVFRKKEKKRLEVQKWPTEATASFRVWVATEVFFVATEFSSIVSRHGSLCCDIVHRLQRVARSQHGFSWS